MNGVDPVVPVIESAWSSPPTIAAIGAVVLAVFQLFKSGQIHTLVNSNMTAVKADLMIANEKIAGLQALVEKMTVAEAKAADAVAETLAAAVSPPAPTK